MMAEEEFLWKNLTKTGGNPWDILQGRCYVHGGRPIDLTEINAYIQSIEDINPSRSIYEALRQMFVNAKTDILEKNLQITISEIHSLKREIEDIKKGNAQLLFKIDENPHALDDLFDMIDKAPSKFKSQKEFDKWLEEE